MSDGELKRPPDVGAHCEVPQGNRKEKGLGGRGRRGEREEKREEGREEGMERRKKERRQGWREAKREG